MNKQEEVVQLIKNPVPKKRVGIIKTQIVKEGSLLYEVRRFKTPREAVGLVKGLFEYADREMMVVVSLNAKNTPLAVEIVSVGTVNSCLVQIREIFKHAILDNAVNIICFHNHPSGIPEPSQEDIDVTKRLEEAGRLLGIGLLDHIILGEDGQYVSLQEEKRIKNGYINLQIKEDFQF